MGGWVLDWSVDEVEQCWRELLLLWHFEGFKASLTSGRVEFCTKVTAEAQPEWEVVETVARQARDYIQQYSWAEPALWIQ